MILAEKKSTILPSALSQGQSKSCQKQNQILSDFIARNDLFTGVKDIAFSRDRKGHLLVLTIDTSERIYTPCYEINCYMLGVKENSSELYFHNVGHLDFSVGDYKICNADNALRFYDNFDPTIINFSFANQQNTNKRNFSNAAYILYLTVYDEFNNLGIAKIMMQAVENMCKTSNIRTITLSSLQSYIPLKSAKPTNREQASMMLSIKLGKTRFIDKYRLRKSKNIDFIRENYFDKNLYLYSSLGYYEYLSSFPRLDKNYDTMGQLKKENLNYVDLSQGITSQSEYVPEDFLMDHLNSSNMSKFIDQISTRGLFRMFYKTYSNDFSPIELSFDEQGTKFLQDILNACRLQKYDRFSETSKHDENYSSYSSSPKFKKFVEEAQEK